MATSIQVGRCYWTKVSGQVVEVYVISDNKKPGRRFLVKRCDNGKELKERRSASALHTMKGPWY